MGKKIRSARGELCDFDEILIKQQIANMPSAVEVSARKEYIDIKDGIKKKTNKKSKDLDSTIKNTSTENLDVALKEELQIAKKKKKIK